MFLTSELKENAVKLIIRLLFEVLGDKTTGNTFLLQTNGVSVSATILRNQEVDSLIATSSLNMDRSDPIST